MSRLTGNQPPSQEADNINFPLTGEVLRAENLTLLQETIWARPEVMAERAVAFEQTWPDRWRGTDRDKYFQTEPSESPFSKYSSQGWKLHIAFEKGKEKDVSQFLFSRGLYFKTQSGMGTWFNGSKESGSTIYVGSWDAMSAVADHLRALSGVLTDGIVSQVNGQRVLWGSGSDIEVVPKMAARFDVYKSPYGVKGSGKYTEDGLPSSASVFGLCSALPKLAGDGERMVQARDAYREHRLALPDLLAVYEDIQRRAQEELIQDFGEDFVIGRPGPSRLETIIR